MTRQLTGKIVIATHNPGKLREMQDLLAPYGIDAISAGALGLGEPEEIGTTFAANALIKARAAADAAKMPAFADDSGLCVDALDGAPGIVSARWGGEAKDFAFAMARVEHETRATGKTAPWTARFVSALCIAWPDGHTESFEGIIEGDLVFPPRGTQGFGYDAIFRPENNTRTFGEMSAQEKHGLPADGSQALSHRARAFQMLAKACLKRDQSA